MNISYYKDDDYPIVIRYTKPVTFHVFRIGDKKWFELPLDNSYQRELFIGQGNNCMTEISEKEAKMRVKGIIDNDIYGNDEKSFEDIFYGA